ncbi:MAG TPA: tRNA modification GTPase, partial [Lachnospiraceae bacterium]|nr:tRNA modification GTPase [Lachnospiraceae bacterium]
GTFGLCMGGGFAYRAAAKYSDIKCCVNLFPLFLSMVENDNIPRWMRQGR